MAIGITKGLGTWKNPQEQSVERFTDNVSYQSVHPDDTLILAGPPRLDDVDQAENATGDQAWKTLLAIGVTQGFQFGSQKPTQPMQSIGSGRSFFVSGKSQTTWRLGRLFCNGRNLLRVLYHNAAAIGGDLKLQEFDDSPVAEDSSDLYYMNLDSELFYIPMGIGVIFKDKVRDFVGAAYLELCMVQSYGLGLNAGQNMIMEDVAGMCDRVKPFRASSVLTGNTQRIYIDTIIGFGKGSSNVPSNGTGLSDNLTSTEL